MVKIDMDRTSQIAFIKLTDEQKKKFAESILNNIEGIKKAGNLEGINPTTKITKNICYRKDEVVSPSNREDLLKNAKGNSNGAFSVPKIVE